MVGSCGSLLSLLEARDLRAWQRLPVRRRIVESWLNSRAWAWGPQLQSQSQCAVAVAVAVVVVAGGAGQVPQEVRSMGVGLACVYMMSHQGEAGQWRPRARGFLLRGLSSLDAGLLGRWTLGAGWALERLNAWSG